MYPLNRDEMRRAYFTAWEKFKAQQKLEPVEQQIVQVIIDHPEYHYIFDSPKKYLEVEFFPELGEVNPYMHLAMHLAIRDQIAVDKPDGLRAIFEQLAKKHSDVLPAEHEMMECLAHSLWHAMQPNSTFDAEAYMESLRKLV